MKQQNTTDHIITPPSSKELIRGEENGVKWNIPAIINKTVLAGELGMSKQGLDYHEKKGISDDLKKKIEIIFTKHLTKVKI